MAELRGEDRGSAGHPASSSRAAAAAAQRADRSGAVGPLSPDGSVGARVLEPAPRSPSPAASQQVIRLLARPFAGEYHTSSFNDHDVPEEFIDQNGRIINAWGERIAQDIDGHQGYDFRLPEGVPLLAAADGEVVFAGMETSRFCPVLGVTTAGQVVTIQHHAPGPQFEEVFRTVHAHLSRIDVQVGQLVRQGQQLGLSGNTGCSTEPHLHFDVFRWISGRQGFVTTDPYGWEGPGPDPWAQLPRGTSSFWLWQENQAPALFRESSNPLPTANTSSVAITGVRYTDWRDDLFPNGEFVELTLDPRIVPSGSFDLTGWTLRNDAGEAFAFPAGFRIQANAAVRVFTGPGANSATELHWGQTGGKWSNRGDCVRLVDPTGSRRYRWGFLGGTCGDPPPPTATPLPTRGPTPTPTPGPPPPAGPGGKSFTLEVRVGTTIGSGIRLSWQAGAAQTGYYLLRVATGGTVLLPPDGTPLSATFTRYTDYATLSGLTCYLLLPVGSAGPLGNSDLLCVIPNIQSGRAPSDFRLRLGQSNTATFFWTPVGGQDGQSLLPLGGAPLALAGSAATATHAPAGPTCYMLLSTAGGAALGNTDVVCAIPGFSRL